MNPLIGEVAQQRVMDTLRAPQIQLEDNALDRAAARLAGKLKEIGQRSLMVVDGILLTTMGASMGLTTGRRERFSARRAAGTLAALTGIGLVAIGVTGCGDGYWPWQTVPTKNNTIVVTNAVLDTDIKGVKACGSTDANRTNLYSGLLRPVLHINGTPVSLIPTQSGDYYPPTEEQHVNGDGTIDTKTKYDEMDLTTPNGKQCTVFVKEADVKGLTGLRKNGAVGGQQFLEYTLNSDGKTYTVGKVHSEQILTGSDAGSNTTQNGLGAANERTGVTA